MTSKSALKLRKITHGRAPVPVHSQVMQLTILTNFYFFLFFLLTLENNHGSPPLFPLLLFLLLLSLSFLLKTDAVFRSHTLSLQLRKKRF